MEPKPPKCLLWVLVTVLFGGIGLEVWCRAGLQCSLLGVILSEPRTSVHMPDDSILFLHSAGLLQTQHDRRPRWCLAHLQHNNVPVRGAVLASVYAKGKWKMSVENVGTLKSL